MEPITFGIMATLAIISTISMTADIAVSTVLLEREAEFRAVADKQTTQVQQDYEQGKISQQQYALEKRRARQVRRIYLENADLAADMAEDKALGAVKSGMLDVVLAGNPGAKAGKFLGARSGRVVKAVTRVGGKGMDVYGNYISLEKSLKGIGEHLTQPVSTLDRSVDEATEQAFGASNDNLVNSILGHILTYTVAEFRRLEKAYPDDEDKLYQAFEAVLNDSAKRLKSYDNYRGLVGAGLRFANEEELKGYLKSVAEDRVLPAALFPEDSWEADPESSPTASSPEPEKATAAYDAHPCLDDSVPVDFRVSPYSRAGSGSSFYHMKGSLICINNRYYEEISADSLIRYSCDREGKRFVNCRETSRVSHDSTESQTDGSTVYRFDDGYRWYVVRPVSGPR